MRPMIRAAFVLIAFLTMPLLAAEQPWSGAPLTGDPKAILTAAKSVSAGESSAVILLEEVHYTFDADGRAVSHWRLVFRVDDESAVEEWGTVEAEWSPWMQAKPEVAARVIAADGSVHVLDQKAVTESAAREESSDIFSDDRRLRAPLPGMAAGVVVEQVITYRDHNPLFETGIAGQLMFGRDVPVEQARLVIDAPASLALRFVNESAPRIEPVKTGEDGRQRIVFASGRMEPLEDLEWNLPYDQSNVPYIAFSTGTSWQEAARRYAEIVDRQIGDAGSVQPFLRAAIGNSTGAREVATKALAAIQKNIRYAGVEVGEGAVVPRSPKDVLALKYGDCKDKATLLVAMLRAAGIPAHVALLKAGTDLDVDADLPSLRRFNHAIVRVGGDDPFWIDPTDEFSPAGTLPISDQNRQALVADTATTGLTRTPASDSSANVMRETRTFHLAEEGKAAVTEVTEATGAYDSSYRRYAARADKKEYRESMESYAKNVYAADSLKNLEHTDPRDLSKPFRLTLDVAGAQRGQTGDIDAAMAIMPANLVESLPWSLRTMPEKDENKPAKPRVHDFVIFTPHVKELHYRIVPPPGFVARTLPPSETKQLGTTTLSTKYEVAADGAVLATLRFDSGKSRLTPAEMEATRKAVSAFAEGNAIVIGFDSIGWTKMNAGDIGGALAEFRRLAQLHPKEALHRVQVGRAYFVGGLGEAAREEFRRAIALDPKYAPAHRYLGIALQHDLLAREFRKGFDLDGAIAAYRKAKELDPKNVEIRGELAKLLSRGMDGDLYSAGARLGEAIDEYKAVAADLEDDRYEGELLTVMAHAGRFDEMKTRARDVKDADQRMVALVVATAAADGIDAALREAGAVDANTRRRILGQAFPTLLHLRRYAEAATALEQASQGTPEAAQVRPLIDILRRTRKFEDLPPGQDPMSTVLRLMSVSSTSADPEAEVRKHLASWIVAADDEMKRQLRKLDRPEENKMRAALRSARAQGNGLPPRVAADIGLAAIDLTQEGDDTNGYRIRLRARVAMPGSQPTMETFHLVRENGRYVAAGDQRGLVGFTALHFLENDELEKARIWLNWAREDISAGGGDDPLSGPAFAILWPKAKATATADEIRAAAAALLTVGSDYAAAAPPHLEAVRDKVPEAMRVQIDLALAVAYQHRHEAQLLLPVARRLVEAAPDSLTAFEYLAMALVEAGDVQEAQRIAAARLEKIPNDAAALRVLSQAAARAGDYENSDEYVRQLIDRSTASATDYNRLAWNALFHGKSFDHAIESANQAVSLMPTWQIIHTLAAVYAEAGRSDMARTKLFECMDAAGRDEPAAVDWYVLGRIAENYGATDAALAAYKRVTMPRQNVTGSAYELAQRRVHSLGQR